jgi:superfamily II DNA or RNA helicase
MEHIRNKSYLGKKGYTIPKNILPPNELEFIKNDLFMKPFSTIKIKDDNSPFPSYRENDNKIYIPRFYGIQRYGLPDNTDISTGIDISVNFTKTLRDYQIDIVNTYINYVNTPISHNSSFNGNGAILEVRTGRGKTVMALDIISKLSKKTLIIVHKEFLLNQWVERIQEFLPTAKIGKIQANVCDVHDKDIVIGMLQTLYSRTLDTSIYSQFGLTIIDEVHRIGSEQFSKALFKCISPYMLGISATVERKDRLTNLLYMFIGKRIYKDTNADDDNVIVRSINYISNDTEFNQVEYDFRGNPKYSTMISKLCNFGRRSDFIVSLLKDLISENNDKQIMILAHNRNLLKYLFDSIQHLNFATVGYYLGGMKQSDLKISETKQIVIATYAMAAEALDIKTLSTLVMATPKTDITQSIGRILRVKGNNPIVIDIIDTHELFQKQWLQRKRYYKKNDYFIYNVDSHKYTNMIDTQWNVSFDPSNKKTDKKTKPKCLIQL